ncbi:MAG TPA: DUF308 domain-containing protein [Solirubrobacteraceae bacterium]|jgi:uncharacterized membrane protein HdeD (DUF308 family)|nr:DUF308 domain-containing protein [Solirubrobacteraceae bacterium]
MRAGAAASGRPGETLGRARRRLQVTAVLAVLAGVVAIAVPVLASVTISLFIGWILVFAGIVTGIHALSQHPVRRAAGSLLSSLLTALVGLYIVIFPLSGTVTLTFMLALWFFVSGALRVVAAWRGQGIPGAWIVGLNGILTLVLGFLIAASLPSSAGWAIGLLVGINLIFWGVEAMVAARMLKAVSG